METTFPVAPPARRCAPASGRCHYYLRPEGSIHILVCRTYRPTLFGLSARAMPGLHHRAYLAKDRRRIGGSQASTTASAAKLYP